MRKALIDHSRHLNKIAEVSPFATNNRWKPLNLRPSPCPLPELPERALHKKSWAVIDRPYSLGFATVGALYERPRYITCAKPPEREDTYSVEPKPIDLGC